MISETLGLLLHQCSKTKALQHGLSLHAALLKSGTKSNVFVCNHLLNMYAKCGSISSARMVFDEMPERNLVSWSAMISGYDQAEKPLMAIKLFAQMRLVPNEYILASVLSACASLSALVQGWQIHALALKLGRASVSFVSNSLISMYMKCSCCNDALLLFASAAEPSCVSFNAIIAGLVENQNWGTGFEMFKLMRQRGFVPDQFTFVGLLGKCMDIDDVRRGMELHCQTVKLRLDSSPFVGNLIIAMYSRFTLIEEAEMAFRSIKEKDIVSWNTLIAACSHCLDYSMGFRIFRDMRREVNVMADCFTFSSALAVCAGLASVRHGKQIHAYLIRDRLDEDIGVGNALVNMYAKCGFIINAHTVFNKLGCRNLVSWNSIIGSCGNYGLEEKAFKLFELMKETGEKPDSVTFVGLITACNHAGLVEEGRSYFNSMKALYGIDPNVEHFSCFIDLLGRSGRLQEAEAYLVKSPFGQDPVILGSLLSACRLHNDVVIGERLARQLLELQPSTSSPYVLLSNLYASDRKWDDALKARMMLRGRGLKKDPGHSLIEVKEKIHTFTIGDFSHARAAEILDMLNNLNLAKDEIFSHHCFNPS